MGNWNAVQLAWIRACERKLNKKVECKSAEDVRVLARMCVQTYSPETLIVDGEE